MIDFHCHILPGLDDGAKDWEESIEMARYLAGQGVTGIVATPHWMEGYYTPEPGEILAKVKLLQGKLSGCGINIKIYPGCEAHISSDLPELVKQGKVLTVNNGGKYLLVELPFREIPMYTDQILFQLQLEGITPVIAHPERNEFFAGEPEKLAAYIQRGYLVQINAGSLLGIYGHKVKKTVMTLLDWKSVHLLGSHMHGGIGREIPVSDAGSIIAEKAGAEEMNLIMQSTAEEIIVGKSITVRVQERNFEVAGFFKRLAVKILQ